MLKEVAAGDAVEDAVTGGRQGVVAEEWKEANDACTVATVVKTMRKTASVGTDEDETRTTSVVAVTRDDEPQNRQRWFRGR